MNEGKKREILREGGGMSSKIRENGRGDLAFD